VIYLKFNPITLVLILAFAYPVIKGFLSKFSSSGLKGDIQEVGSNIAFIASLFLGVFFSKKIFIEHDSGIYKDIYESIPQKVLAFTESNNMIFYAVVIPAMVFIFYQITSFLMELINKITLYPVVDILGRFIENKSSLFKRLSGAIIEVPKGLVYVLFITFLINILSIFNMTSKYSAFLEDSKPYNFLCREVVIPATNSSVAKQLPNILNNSFKVVVKDAGSQSSEGSITDIASNNRVVVYYNGVTLEEGIKSNSSIDTFAKELGSKGASSRDKAKLIYNWVGSNISYDYDKADRVLSNDFNIKSGAISAFQTRKGICFDYACLFTAMARANGLKVRIMTGEGFNGVSWVSHAWNEVYIPEEDKWYKVDPTFYKGGNYFNSRRFDLDHRAAQVAGEW
jgi:hypothetical protein